ncbi:MAG: Na+/H+ antiporter subunit E [Oscillospiraceae bacterium]|nr:Na+/H+ antiporter subunit E [Oscillospiraceae bacterium]
MQKTKFSAVIATFLVCFAFWILLTWSFTVQELAVGAAVSIAVALFSARFFIHEHAGWLFNPVRFFSCIGFWCGTFVVELVKANVNMARICFDGCKDINPGIVKIPTALKSDYGLAALSNSITLTPGTITVEVAEEDGQNYLYVHWIDVKETDPEKAGEAIKGSLEKGLRRVWE